MTGTEAKCIRGELRYRGIKKFNKRVLLASPTMHGDELGFVEGALGSGEAATAGANIDGLEKEVAGYVGVKNAVALSSGTAALHMAVKLAAEEMLNVGKTS